MKLTTRRGFKRINLVDELASALAAKERLSRELVQTKADLALARSSAVEWRDRYQRFAEVEDRGGKPYAGWGSSREFEKA